MRITNKILDELANRINLKTNNPIHYISEVNGKRIINIGHYHIDSAYGGHKLVQTMNDAGGIRSVLYSGYTTRKNLFALMQAYLTGLCHE